MTTFWMVSFKSLAFFCAVDFEAKIFSINPMSDINKVDFITCVILRPSGELGSWFCMLVRAGYNYIAKPYLLPSNKYVDLVLEGGDGRTLKLFLLLEACKNPPPGWTNLTMGSFPWILVCRNTNELVELLLHEPGPCAAGWRGRGELWINGWDQGWKCIWLYHSVCCRS